MATIGIPGDVLNSVFWNSAYPVGRTYGSVPAAATDFSYRNNYAGELGGLNQDYRGVMVSQVNPANVGMGRKTNADISGVTPANTDSGKRPAMWFIGLFVGFIIFAWAAKKFAPDGESYALIKPNLVNGVFLTLWIVLILALLKQVALRVNIPGLSHLILSV
jgi:hypothetical protein